MTADQWLTFFYPYFSNTLDSRNVASDIRASALALALTKAPLCEAVPVGSELQMQAIAHYAAYILDTRQANINAGTGVSGLVLKREKEGDVEREWMAQTSQETTNVTQGADAPYERWQEIAAMCPRVSGLRLRTLRI